MIDILQEILDWSEVWAPLIPLIVLSFRGKQPSFLNPIIIYLWFALVIDSIIDAGWKFGWKFEGAVPGWMHPNNYLYNIHSIVRFICFSSFFIMLKQPFHTRIKKIIPLISLLFLIINFRFFENFYEVDTISSRLFAVESGLLLFYCLQYYLFKLQEEDGVEKRGPAYWVVMGLSIYVVFNFFYFLFYTTLIESGYGKFVAYMWNYHNITFIILCIFIAKAFHASGHK
jgi:hypothetical protein